MSKRAIFIFLCIIFFMSIITRILFSPDINFETDSFSVLLSAKNIVETGNYKIPPVSLIDSIHSKSYTGWAVGYPLVLSAFFSLFGYSEGLARLMTLIACSTSIFFIYLLGNRIHSKKAGFIASFLYAINPLLVCTNSRILTVNMGSCFLVMSISLFLLSLLRRETVVEFRSAKEILHSKKCFLQFGSSFLFLGLTLATRDDFAIFGITYLLFGISIVRRTFEKGEAAKIFNCLKLACVAFVGSVTGFLPNIYFNLKNYGKLLTSSHYEYGGRLSLNYFFKGEDGGLNYPGFAIMIMTFLIFAFPVVSLLIPGRPKGKRIIKPLILSMMVPIFFINGSYYTTSSGASPRYIIPVIPFILLLASIVLLRESTIMPKIRSIFLGSLIIWHIFMYYPPKVIFTKLPKLAYVTQYSPWYNTHDYLNYPHPVHATIDWVVKNTSPDSIILSDYDQYHYFFYAKRDVINRNNIEEIKKYLNKRPLFFIEDHQKAINHDLLNPWKTQLQNNSMDLREKGLIPLFSPYKGRVNLKIYEIISKIPS